MATDFMLYMETMGVTSWILITILLLLGYWYHVNRGQRSKLPPGPPYLPIVGSLPFFKSTDIRVALREFQKKYGDMFTVDVGMNREVVLNSYDVIKEALVKQGTAFAGRPISAVGMYFRDNKGILLTNGEKWQEQRRYALHTLREFGLGRNLMEEVILVEIDKLFSKLEKYVGKPHNPKCDIQLASANIITSFAFGRRMEYDDPAFQKLVTVALDTLAAVGSGGLLVLFPFLRHIPFFDVTGYRSMESGTLFTTECIRQWIEDKKAELDEKVEHSDLISRYLLEIKKHKNDSNTYFTEDQLTWIVFDLYAGGMETTSATMVWVFVYLILHPEVQTKVQKELDEVVGLDRRISLKDRPKLPYCEAVISEIMRLIDLAPMVPKLTTEDATVGGYFIPKGTNILVNMNSVHHDPKIYPDPKKFDPTRFLDDKGHYKKNEALIPFSIGRRACVGESLARMENFLFFTSFCQQYTFSIPEGYPKPDTEGILGLANSAKPFDLLLTSRR